MKKDKTEIGFIGDDQPRTCDGSGLARKRRGGALQRRDGDIKHKVIKCGNSECDEEFEGIKVGGRVKRYCSNRCKCADWDRKHPRQKEGEW